MILPDILDLKPKENDNRLSQKCPECGEFIYRAHDGLIIPRACACRRKLQEEHDLFEAKRKEQEKADNINRLFKESRISPRFKERTFNNFDSSLNPMAYKQCKDYALNFSGNKKTGSGLCLSGTVGTGKTHLAGAIANALINRGYSVVFGTLVNLLDKLRREINETEMKAKAGEIMRAIERCDLLIIDDLGKEKISAWAKEKIYTAINDRYEHYLPIVITTNYGLEQLKDHIGEACVDRLIETCETIVFTGESQRRKIARERLEKTRKLRAV